MESIFANDSTEDLLEMVAVTKEKIVTLQDEVESCTDCIEDINQKLLKGDRTMGKQWSMWEYFTVAALCYLALC